MAETKKKSTRKRVVKPKKDAKVKPEPQEVQTIVDTPVEEPAPEPVQEPVPEQGTETASPEPSMETVQEPVQEAAPGDGLPQVTEVLSEPLVTPSEPQENFPETIAELQPSTQEMISEPLKQDGTAFTQKPVKGKSVFFKVAGFILILSVLILGSVYVYFSSIQEPDIEAPAPLDIPAVTEEETSPVEEIVIVDRTLYEITVLNGSGINGEAARAKGILELEQFTVASIGNADRSSYSETVITAGEEVSAEYIEELRNTLSETYTVLAEVAADDSGNEVTVIVGYGMNEEEPSSAEE